MEEIWKNIPGYDFYEASNLGRIRSWRQWGGNNRQHNLKASKPRLMTPCPNGEGYMCISVRKNKKNESIRIHKLIMLAFYGPSPNPKIHICHTDGDKKNNLLENLRYDTATNNCRDRLRHRQKQRFLSVEEVIEIKKLLPYMNNAQLSRKFDYSTSGISYIRHGKRWGWVELGL